MEEVKIYKLTQRKGRCVQVSYDDGKTWTSTGCYTKEQAIEKLNGHVDIKFSEYARNFYRRRDDKSIYFINALKNKVQSPSTLRNKQYRLNEYLIPRFGCYNLRQIKAYEIEGWFIGIKDSRTGELLAEQTRDMILYEFQEILDRAYTEGLVDCNEARKIKPITIRHKQRPVISAEELKVLFPDKLSQLLSNFDNNLRNTLYFCILKDTGFRPSEALALRWEDVREDGSVYTEYIFDVLERKIVHRIKTSNRGKNYKAGMLSEQTMKLYKMYGNNSQYIFHTHGDNVLDQIIANKAFKKACEKVLNRTDLTQYCLRHAFMTQAINNRLPKELIMELMGHVQWESCYDDRTPEEKLENIRKALSQYQEQLSI